MMFPIGASPSSRRPPRQHARAARPAASDSSVCVRVLISDQMQPPNGLSGSGPQGNSPRQPPRPGGALSVIARAGVGRPATRHHRDHSGHGDRCRPAEDSDDRRACQTRGAGLGGRFCPPTDRDMLVHSQRDDRRLPLRELSHTRQAESSRRRACGLTGRTDHDRAD